MEDFLQIKRELMDEYERRNVRLADCLRSMEGIYDKQKEDFQKKQSSLEAENRELRKKLEMSLSLGSKSSSKQDKEQHETDTRRVKFKMTGIKLDLVQELENKIKELNQELQKKDELSGYRRKRDDWAKSKLEAEVKALRKKATVGWMLGSLWEVSLQGDELGETIQIVKMLRKLQKDLERESLTGESTDALDKDVQLLLDNVQAVIQRSGTASRTGRRDETSQGNGPQLPDRLTRAGLVHSPRSPTSPTSPKSPRPATISSKSTSDGHKSISYGKEPNVQDEFRIGSPSSHSNAAIALLEMHSLCEDPEFQGIAAGTGKNRGDIKQMLSSIDSNIRALLESERKRISSSSIGGAGGSGPGAGGSSASGTDNLIKPSSPPGPRAGWKG